MEKLFILIRWICMMRTEMNKNIILGSIGGAAHHSHSPVRNLGPEY